MLEPSYETCRILRSKEWLGKRGYIWRSRGFYTMTTFGHGLIVPLSPTAFKLSYPSVTERKVISLPFRSLPRKYRFLTFCSFSRGKRRKDRRKPSILEFRNLPNLPISRKSGFRSAIACFFFLGGSYLKRRRKQGLPKIIKMKSGIGVNSGHIETS